MTVKRLIFLQIKMQTWIEEKIYKLEFQMEKILYGTKQLKLTHIVIYLIH